LERDVRHGRLPIVLDRNLDAQNDSLFAVVVFYIFMQIFVFIFAMVMLLVHARQLQQKKLDEAIALLRSFLAGRAEVYPTRELIARNLFGSPNPSAAFLGRMGNVTILPYAGETVWWLDPGRFAMVFSGHHGGLTPEEMEIPLLLLSL